MNLRRIYKNFVLILGLDVLLLLVSIYAAYLIRFDGNIPAEFMFHFKHILPILILVKLAVFYYFDLYRGMWRYTSIADLVNVVKGATASSVCIVFLVLVNHKFEGFSRSVFLIDWCLTLLLISGLRLSVRFYFEYVSGDTYWQNMPKSLMRHLMKRNSGAERLLIIGAGNCGEKIYREICNNRRLRYHVIGFLDDHPVKLGKKIHGVPVLHNIAGLPSVVRKMKIDEILIAIPSATASQMRRIVGYCRESGIKYRTIPNMGELINGSVSVNAIREVAYRDLLGREAVQLDHGKIGAYLKGQRVLVTGAGGSIGSELCRQICRFEPESLLLFEMAETPLYDIELELKHHFAKVNLVPLLADIQSRNDLEKVFQSFLPQTVFHAAAYKHVPMLEHYPWKAIETNIVGTKQIVRSSVKYGVERFVFVSTDKAVRPANVMGTTKRIAEMFVQNQNSCEFSRTKFMTVRFGNVIGSSGSVVPLFKKQIQKGGPVTVTHPDVTRYFMTIPEACQLILQAGSMGNGGETFILDMGKPIKIDTLARELIRFSGFEPGEDIEIKYIGLRPGEKLYEELITEGEGIVATSHKKIMVLKSCGCNLSVLNGSIDALARVAEDQNIEMIRRKLQEIVPEYTLPVLKNGSGTRNE